MSWSSVALGEICRAKPLKKNSVDEKQDVWQLNLDQVESNSGNILSKVKAPYSEAGNSTHWFDDRHVLYSKLRPYLNKVVLPDELGLATTELVPLLPDPKRLDRRFLVYYLRSNEFVNWVNGQVAGAKMPRVSMKVFWEHEIPLPPLPEQKRIAAILNKADAIRRKRQHAIQLADQFLRAVFLEMFGDPVTNSKGWEVGSIDALCTDIVDCVNRTAPVVEYETPYKMIRTTNVRNSKLLLTDLRCVEKDVYEKWIRRLKPARGDIIFTREAPAGEAAIVDTDDLIFLGQRTMHFRPDTNSVTAEFLMTELMGTGVKRQISKMHAGSTVTHLSVPECKKFDIRVPPIELQKKFSTIYEDVRAIKEKHAVQEGNGQDQFSSLSQKAFSGKL